VNALAKLIGLSDEEKARRGLVHTPHEIAQQPQTWESTYRLFQRCQKELAEFLSASGIADSEANKATVVLVGAGTSDYIGRSLVPVLRRLWQSEVIAVPSTDLLTHLDENLTPGRRYLWISFSRSGDSPEGVAVLEKAWATHPEIRHLIISCNREGTMARAASSKPGTMTVVLDDEVNDRGLAMTSSYSNMVVFGQCAAHVQCLDVYEPILRQLVEGGMRFLPTAADFASSLTADPFSKVCFLGSGALRGAAVESALKVLELTAGRTLSMAESPLGLRHGPMAALDEETLLISYVSSDPKVLRYETDLLREIAAKKLVRTQISVSAIPGPSSNGFAPQTLSWGSPNAVPDDCRPPVDVILGQLLGLFFSLRWNLTPDKPSPTGAISRVVQGVTIYS
jgi:tagatose-6-phosphate ketose/aldose isomerase